MCLTHAPKGRVGRARGESAVTVPAVMTLTHFHPSGEPEEAALRWRMKESAAKVLWPVVCLFFSCFFCFFVIAVKSDSSVNEG